jgi:replicative DNA helicase
MAQFDERLSGARDVMVLAAGPGVGKTMFALQLGKGVAQHWDDNHAVFVLVSLEMPRWAMYIRLLCGQAGLDWKTITLGSAVRRGQPAGPWFTADHQEQIDQAKQELLAGIGRRILILDRETLGANLTVTDLLARVSAFKAQVGAARAFIAIDYLQLLPVPDKVASESDLEADRHRIKFVQDLLAGTRSEGNPDGDALLVISEARKPSSGKTKNWATNPADLMGSARIAYAADAILLYHQMDEDEVGSYAWPIPWDYAQNLNSLQHDGIAPVKLTLAKGRDGMRRGSWALAFHFEESRFTEVEGEPSEEQVPVLPVHQALPANPENGNGTAAQDSNHYYS